MRIGRQIGQRFGPEFVGVAGLGPRRVKTQVAAGRHEPLYGAEGAADFARIGQQREPVFQAPLGAVSQVFLDGGREDDRLDARPEFVFECFRQRRPDARGINARPANEEGAISPL